MEGSRKLVNPLYYPTAVNYYSASKAPKPSSSTPSASSSATTPAAAAAAASVVFIVNHDCVTPQPKQTVFLSPKEIGGDWWSSYSGGVATYKNVDLKAASYIACVQDRFRSLKWDNYIYIYTLYVLHIQSLYWLYIAVIYFYIYIYMYNPLSCRYRLYF